MRVCLSAARGAAAGPTHGEQDLEPPPAQEVPVEKVGDLDGAPQQVEQRDAPDHALALPEPGIREDGKVRHGFGLHMTRKLHDKERAPSMARSRRVRKRPILRVHCHAGQTGGRDWGWNCWECG